MGVGENRGDTEMEGEREGEREILQVRDRDGCGDMVRDTNALEVDEGKFGVGVLDKVSRGVVVRVIP